MNDRAWKGGGEKYVPQYPSQDRDGSAKTPRSESVEFQVPARGEEPLLQAQFESGVRPTRLPSIPFPAEGCPGRRDLARESRPGSSNEGHPGRGLM